jgi:hypothetical protein
MSAPVAGPAPTPLSRIAFGGFGRVALAGLVLVMAAVTVTMSGGAGLAGRVGSLFGVQSHAKTKPVAVVEVAGPVKAVVNSVRQSTAAAHSQRSVVRRRVSTRRHAGGTPQQSPAPGAPRPAPALPPSQPAPPPVVPKPQPTPTGNVEKTVKTLHDTAAPVVPQAQPVLDQAQQTVSQACGLIGGCP